MDARRLVRAVAWVGLLAVSVLPAVRLAMDATTTPGPSSAGLPLGLLLRTLALGVAATAGAVLLGVPAGLILGRTDAPLRGPSRVLLAAPLVAPPLVLAVAWQDLLAGAAPGLIRGLGGAVAILAVWLAPLIAFATEAVARRIAPSLEEAALLVERSAIAVLRRVTLPLMAPAIGAVALFAFALAIGEFAVPTVLGAAVYPSEVFLAFADLNDYGGAALKSLPLVALVVAAAVAASLAGLDRVISTLGARGERPPLVLSLGRPGKALATTYLLLLASIAVIVPVASLAIRTDVPAVLDSVRLAVPALRRSLALSLGGATVAVLLGVAIATARPRASHRRLETAALLAIFALPPGVLGLGLLRLSAGSATLEAGHDRGLLVLAAHAARFAPLVACFLAAARNQLPRSLEEAAHLARLGFPGTVARVLAPLLAGAIGVAWLLAFVLALGELGATYPLLPAGLETVPSRVFAIHANAPQAKVAAASLLLFGLAIVSTGVLFLLSRFIRARRP